MVALGEMWRKLSPEEKLVYNNQAKLVFQVNKTTSPQKDNIPLPDTSKRPEKDDNLSQEGEEDEDNVGETKKQSVESESDSNEEISDSSENPEDVN